MSVDELAPIGAVNLHWLYLQYTKLRRFIETQSLSAERAGSGKSSNENLPL